MTLRPTEGQGRFGFGRSTDRKLRFIYFLLPLSPPLAVTVREPMGCQAAAAIWRPPAWASSLCLSASAGAVAQCSSGTPLPPLFIFPLQPSEEHLLWHTALKLPLIYAPIQPWPLQTNTNVLQQPAPTQAKAGTTQGAMYLWYHLD